MSKKICAHVLVENEEKFVWFSVTSVLDYVDEVLIYDAGSTDKTPQIINHLKESFPNKITTQKVKRLTPQLLSEIREEMLSRTKSDWVLIVDGDEVWWKNGIEQLINAINKNGDTLDSIVTRYINCVGDIFHYQNENAGRYKIGTIVGNITIRAINRKIKGLHVAGKFPIEGYMNYKNTLVQNLSKDRRLIIPDPGYLHLTYLPRTSVHLNKYKMELGKRLPLDYFYPEAFFKPRPAIVPSPWQTLAPYEKIVASFYENPRKIKRWTKLDLKH